MAQALTGTGAFKVDGTWATSIRYEADLSGDKPGLVNLTFLQGRYDVARSSVPLEALTDLVGPDNGAAIAKTLSAEADPSKSPVRGELKGKRLHYHEVSLLGEAQRENTLARQVPDVPGGGRADPDLQRPPREAAAASTPDNPGLTPSVPAHIAARYVVAAGRYHFTDQQLAFVDRGTRFTVATENAAVLKDLADIAKERQWHSVEVTGTERFRREAWSAAYAAGLHVKGYTPKAVELKAADRVRGSRNGAGPAADASSLDRASDVTPEIAKRSGPQASPTLNAQAAAAAIRSAETTREELQLKYPDLSKAVFRLLSAQEEFAQAFVRAGLVREQDRQEVIAMMRERLAANVEQGRVMRAPDDQRVKSAIEHSVEAAQALRGVPRTPPVPDVKPRQALREEGRAR